MNDVMSFGLHRVWKKIFIDHLCLENDLKILDMASGTGDIAFKIFQKAKKQGLNIELTLADINKDMLKIAEDRVIDENHIDGNFKFHVINGENTGLPENYFDYYTIAYGIRNFTDLNQGLNEAFRVLKPGGKFLCLEFSDIPDGVLKKAYDFYSFNLIPKFGKMITGDEESYQYFVESIRMFPKPNEFTRMITEQKFQNAQFKNLFQGITTIYTAEKP